MKKFGILTFLVAFAAACSDGPSGLPEDAMAIREVVVTAGLPTPPPDPGPPARSQTTGSVPADLGGVVGSPLVLAADGCSAATRTVVATYRVSGKQGNAGSFTVYTKWTWNGASWAGSEAVTVQVAAQSESQDATDYPVTLTIQNASSTSSGGSTLVFSPHAGGSAPPNPLQINNAAVTLHVQFAGCGSANTPPTVVVPADIENVEATSASGAAVPFSVTASDAEDGDLSADVTCDHASGDTFPLGTTTVTCSVTDSGGLGDTASFDIEVVDKTGPAFSGVPSGPAVRIAENSGGWTLDLDDLGIGAADVGNVSPPVSVICTPAVGTQLAIQLTQHTVSCTATDSSLHPSPNSTTVSFSVSVGLDLSGIGGFLPPLRNHPGPYSAHKKGSTIPQKFYAPKYADGSPATDLAGDLRLVIKQVGAADGDEIDVTEDFGAGSTEWRYDATDGHYVFNLKSSTGWAIGEWTTTVSYAGIPLASTNFALKK